MEILNNKENINIDTHKDVGCLLIFGNSSSGESIVDSFPLYNGENIIDNIDNQNGVVDISIHYNSLSSKCAIIYYENGEFFVEDRGIKNGTYRNKQNNKIFPFCKYEVIPGSVLYFGNVKVKLIKYGECSEGISTPIWNRDINLEQTQINEEKNSDFKENTKHNKESNNNKFFEKLKISDKLIKNKHIDEIQKPRKCRNNETYPIVPDKKKKKKETDSVFKPVSNTLANVCSFVKKNLSGEIINTREYSNQITIIWTGCSPTNKDIDILEKYNIQTIEQEDFELMYNSVTHLIAPSIKRTLKFLWAVCKGISIITPQTLKAALALKSYDSIIAAINKAPLLYDSVGERKFGFQLSNSINKARKKPLFEGFYIFICSSIKSPSPNELTWLCKSAQAKIITSINEFKNIPQSKLIIIGNVSDVKIHK
ncbi:hypothetical protein ACR3K2_29890 [Cryptosporidium serpentis]